MFQSQSLSWLRITFDGVEGPMHNGFAHRNDQKIHFNFADIHLCHLKVDYFGESKQLKKFNFSWYF